MKCLIIDAVHSAIAEELSKYMQVDTKMLPTQEELAALIPDYDVLIMRVDQIGRASCRERVCLYV